MSVVYRNILIKGRKEILKRLCVRFGYLWQIWGRVYYRFHIILYLRVEKKKIVCRIAIEWNANSLIRLCYFCRIDLSSLLSLLSFFFVRVCVYGISYRCDQKEKTFYFYIQMQKVHYNPIKRVNDIFSYFFSYVIKIAFVRFIKNKLTITCDKFMLFVKIL